MKQKLLILIIVVLTSIPIYSQNNSIITSGGDISNSNGSINYSIGQIFINTNSNTNNYIIEGNQQPYEIYSLSNSNLDNPNLTIKIFPNPTNDFIFLSYPNYNYENTNFQIFDLNGKEIIKKRKIYEKETKIFLDQFQIGTYLLLITNEDNTTNSFKIIKN